MRAGYVLYRALVVIVVSSLVGFIQRTRVLFGLENVKSPLAEVRRLMFSGKGPVVVTTDHEKFIMIMSAFTTYEKQVCTSCSIYEIYTIYMSDAMYPCMFVYVL